MAINDTLARRNYVQWENSPVNFLITYQLGIEKRTDVDAIETGIGFGHRFTHLGFRTDTNVREYTEITLYIDMIDPEAEKLVWRGTRTYRYQEGGTVAERREIVGEILSGFPFWLIKTKSYQQFCASFRFGFVINLVLLSFEGRLNQLGVPPSK